MNYAIKILFFIISLTFSFSAEAVNNDFDYRKIKFFPAPEYINDESTKRNTPSISIKWGKESIVKEYGGYVFHIESQFPFSYFGVGWTSDSAETSPEMFTIKYRITKDNNENGEWQTTSGEYYPNENSFELYRSDVIFTGIKGDNFKCEIKLIPPDDCNIESVVIDLVKIEYSEEYIDNGKAVSVLKQTEGCSMPDIIPRSEWCSVFADCQEPKYLPEKIYPTHVILHHGASPDYYEDGYRVVRSYWDYHVNSLGWDDIGYNYLIDKYGNIFQGRYNPFDYTVDVKGAHSGSVNSKAIGICFLGNSDITLATQEQVSRFEEFLSWWYNNKEIDPVSKGMIINQAATDTLYLARLAGHRDVKPATICPGESLYKMIPGIITETREKLIECSEREVTSDFYIVNPYAEPDEVIAGGELTLNFTNIQTGKIKQEDLSKSYISVFISKDSVFSPAKDKILFEANNILEGENISSSTFKQIARIDRRTDPGLYYIFFISDFKNKIWETNEFNNEEYITVNVLDNSSVVTAYVEPFNGGTVAGEGKYLNGDTCLLSATGLFGFEFSGWYENDSLISNNLELSFIVVEDRNISAQFVCSSEIGYAEISGEKRACTEDKDYLYILKNVTNGISYEWVLPEGWTGSVNNDSIEVSFSSIAKSGVVEVTVDLGCKENIIKYTCDVEVLRRPGKPELVVKGGVIFSSNKYDSTLNYQWYKNSVLINAYQKNYLDPEEDGLYYLIESNNYCYSFPSEQLKFVNDSLVVGGKQQSVLMFPNPFDDLISVIIYDYPEEEVSFQFYDIGQKQRLSYYKPAGVNFFTIDLSQLERGVYIVKYNMKNKTGYSKLIKR
jgi:hypothetical protein